MFLNSLGLIGDSCASRNWPVFSQFRLDEGVVTVVREDGAEPESLEVRMFREPNIQEMECERAFAPWRSAIPHDQMVDAATYWE